MVCCCDQVTCAAALKKRRENWVSGWRTQEEEGGARSVKSREGRKRMKGKRKGHRMSRDVSDVTAVSALPTAVAPAGPWLLPLANGEKDR